MNKGIYIIYLALILFLAQHKHLIFPFLVYTYFGATYEHLYYHVTQRKKILDNIFVTGFPIYGIGGLLVVYFKDIIEKFTNSLAVKFIIYMTILTSIEYIAGKYVVKVDKENMANTYGYIKSWDYRHEHFNKDGIICLKHSVGWGLMALGVDTLHDKFVQMGKCMIDI